MKHFLFFLQMSVIAAAAVLPSEVEPLGQHGKLIDSTLTIANDSVRFMRDDIDNMPYVANLCFKNPSDSLDILYMPMVIEGGTVKVEISDVLNLTGTDDNRALFRFIKAKNSFAAHYQNPDYDLDKLNRDYSKFYSDKLFARHLRLAANKRGYAESEGKD